MKLIYYSGKKSVLILMVVFLSALYLPSVYSYDGHKFNTDLNISINSNNATSCNITTLKSPNNFYILNLPMTKNGNDYYLTISKTNFTTLGDYCFNLKCTDSVKYEVGSKCFTITPNGKNDVNNIVFIIFIIIIIYAVTLIGFFGRSEWVTLLGAMFMMFLGVYLINNGIIVYRDDLTRYFCYFTIGLGAFLSLFTTINKIQENM